MIIPEEVHKNPEWMTTHKEDLKDEAIFKGPWYEVFRKHPHLYREFSDRYNEMDEVDIIYALRDDPALILDLKNHLDEMSGWDISRALRDNPVLVLEFKDHLHRMDEADIGWLLGNCPELSLCIKYRDYPDKAEAAYYIAFPCKLNDLNKEEKREMSKRIIEFLGKEKI